MLEQLYNAIFIGSIYALFAIGFALVFSVLDILNLAHPTVFMLGAFVALFAIATLGLPWWLAIPIAFVATGLFGIVLDRVAFAPLRRRGAPPLSAMISSLGVTLAVVRLVELRYGGDFLTFPAGTVPAFLIQVGDATLEVVVSVLAGSVNKMVVSELAAMHLRAAGISGSDASTRTAGIRMPRSRHGSRAACAGSRNRSLPSSAISAAAPRT